MLKQVTSFEVVKLRKKKEKKKTNSKFILKIKLEKIKIILDLVTRS